VERGGSKSRGEDCLRLTGYRLTPAFRKGDHKDRPYFPLFHPSIFHAKYILLHAKKTYLARLLAIDYGRKRTGIAVTDPLQIIANSLTTVKTQDLFLYLEQYFNREQVDTIVIGYPKQMNNLPSEAVIYVDPFIKNVRKKWPDKKVVLMDERFTSKMAFQAMIDGGVKKKDRRNKELVDAISATIILQSYMDSIKNRAF